MPVTLTRFQIIAQIPERHSTAFLAPSSFKSQIRCMHCGNVLMAGYNSVYEVIVGTNSQYGYSIGSEEVSFPWTVRCSNKNCGTFWHFHRL